MSALNNRYSPEEEEMRAACLAQCARLNREEATGQGDGGAVWIPYFAINPQGMPYFYPGHAPAGAPRPSLNPAKWEVSDDA